jgi:dienelactone hydrolase
MIAAGLWTGLSGAAQAQQAGIPQQTSTVPAAPVPDALDAAFNEQIVRVPISLKLPDGTQHTGDFVLSVFKPSGAGPFPVIIVNHGRSGQAEKRASFNRSRLLGGLFVRRGFVVLVPTRVGYGPSGHTVDPERSSGNTVANCPAWTFSNAARAITAHIDATLTWARTQPDIDTQRLVLAGTSAGGFGSVVAAGTKPAGLRAVINFAGGVGGAPDKRVGDPCGMADVANKFAAAGARNPVPTLWFYAENDKFWGPGAPRQWHEHYVRAGGKAEFHMFKPVGDDGHEIVSAGVTQWRPLLDTFLTAHGFAPRKLPASVPPASGFAALDDMSGLDGLSTSARKSYPQFLLSDVPRAFAIGPNGAWGWSNSLDAPDAALARCRALAKAACTLYAVNDDVVWPKKPQPR